MKRVLFVCVENSNRSQIAEAFAGILGGSEVESYSAGSSPSGVVNPKAISVMSELGYDLSTHGSKSLDDLPNVEFDLSQPWGAEISARSSWHVSARIGRSQIQETWAWKHAGVCRDEIRERVRVALKELGVPFAER